MRQVEEIRKYRIGPFTVRPLTTRGLRKKLRKLLGKNKRWHPADENPLATLRKPQGSKSEIVPAQGPPVVLIVDSVYPKPDRDSGSVDAWNYIRIFQSLGFSVVFYADAENTMQSTYRRALEDASVYCIAPPSFFSIEEFLNEVGKTLAVCFLSRVYCGGRIIEEVRRKCPTAAVIFNTVDLHHLREERQAHLTDDRKLLHRARLTREREIAVARLADATIVVSSAEEKLLLEAAPGSPVFTVPLIRDLPTVAAPFIDRTKIGFIGGYLHDPNVDAVLYFLDEVWPKVREKLPDAKFVAFGADMPDQVRLRKDLGFEPVGYVEDLAAALRDVRVMVAPLRFGAGAKGKIVTSLSHGVPCVGTPIAVEGMGLTVWENVLVGSTPDELATAVVRLFTDAELWNRLSKQGIALVAEHHSLDHGMALLCQILAQAAPRSLLKSPCVLSR